jgi:hypothetical protein
LQANTFFAGKHFFLQAMLFIKKIADDKNLSSYLSQGDGSLKKNSPYLIKLVREQYMKANQTEPRSLFLHIYSMSNSLQNCDIAYKFCTFKLP